MLCIIQLAGECTIRDRSARAVVICSSGIGECVIVVSCVQREGRTAAAAESAPPDRIIAGDIQDKPRIDGSVRDDECLDNRAGESLVFFFLFLGVLWAFSSVESMRGSSINEAVS